MRLQCRNQRSFFRTGLPLLLPLQGLGHVGVEFGFLHPGHGGDLGFLEGLFGAGGRLL